MPAPPPLLRLLKIGENVVHLERTKYKNEDPITIDAGKMYVRHFSSFTDQWPRATRLAISLVYRGEMMGLLAFVPIPRSLFFAPRRTPLP